MAKREEEKKKEIETVNEPEPEPPKVDEIPPAVEETNEPKPPITEEKVEEENVQIEKQESDFQPPGKNPPDVYEEDEIQFYSPDDEITFGSLAEGIEV